VIRCPFCTQPLPCRCGQSAGVVCPRCGGDPHVGLSRCPEERRAQTARMTARVLRTCPGCGSPWADPCGTPGCLRAGERQSTLPGTCPGCGLRVGAREANCASCGTANPPAQSSRTTTWTDAMSWLRRRYVPRS
jgi:hypothetical protein